MIIHTAFGSLITFATMFWGFWAMDNKSAFTTDYCKVGECTNRGGTRMYLHTFSGIAIALLGLPLAVTGFIAYFRRW